jgi:hypothetical protein
VAQIKTAQRATMPSRFSPLLLRVGGMNKRSPQIHVNAQGREIGGGGIADNLRGHHEQILSTPRSFSKRATSTATSLSYQCFGDATSLQPPPAHWDRPGTGLAKDRTSVPESFSVPGFWRRPYNSMFGIPRDDHVR